MDSHFYAKEIVAKLVKNGFTAYFAGGWVRDHLLKIDSSDVDIATAAPPQAILDLFPHTILVGLAFGIVVVVIEGHQFEVATFRKDIDYSGRKPRQIEMSTAKEDASRRDFTINGMFYDPIEGSIYDYVGGVEDLKKKIIRTIGNPQERFIEDRLRMIRAIRFSCKLDFIIDQETQDAIAENADTLFPAVAMERVWQELTKMSEAPRFDHALIEMHRLKLLPVIFPLLENEHLKSIKHKVAALKLFPKNTPAILSLMTLFTSISTQEKLLLCQYLRVSKKESDLVKLLDRCKLLVDNEKNTTAKEWVDFYANTNANSVFRVDAAIRPENEFLNLIKRHEERIECLNQHIHRARASKPLITAETLKTQGISPGKIMGLLLKEAETMGVNENIHDAERILIELKKSSLWPKKPY